MSKRLSLLALFFVICALMVFVFSAGAQSSSAEPSAADPAAISAPGQSFGLSSARELSSPTAIPSWTRMAYQRWENNNWDIYIYDSGGSQQLTTHAADDFYPDLNRGGTQIAFSSERNNSNGQLDLYIMNIDKSGLKKIFDDWSAFPAFSPDGSMIAFQGWANGNYELFVVNSDGSNLRRLTNNPDFDGQPTWNPNGQQIAFSSRRGGQYGIYTVNTDGSNLQKISTYPLALHPKWSPDGKYIGFDADVDGDGWQEVTLVKPNGSDQQMIFDPGTSATAWAGSWSPDATALGITDISLARQNNQWVWTDGVLKQWNMASKNISQLIPGDTNWYFDWETLDVIPPITQIKPVNQFSDTDTFGLGWSGTDFGGSGVKNYGVHYQSPTSGGWRTFWNNTIATAAKFPGNPGETYEFLVRAQDNAFNLGVWSSQQTVSTTFYKTKISGLVIDNRGTPLSNIGLNINPSPIFPAVTDDGGNFLAYTTSSDVYGLSITNPNYFNLPTTDTIPDQDFNRRLTLIPKDTIVINGTFEASAVTPANWTTSGNLPVFITAANQATGQYSVQFGSVALDGAQALEDIKTGNLTQVVTIPANLQAPTFAFMARADGDATGDNSGLEVVITPDGEAPHTVFNGRLYGSWNLYWFNMQAYVNKKVEIRFSVKQDSTNPPLNVFIDDVSLGSASPELWLDMQALPGSAINGDNVEITIDYGNRGAIAADNTKLVLNLNPTMAYVSSNPPGVPSGSQVVWEWASLAARTGSQTITIQTKVTGSPPAPRPVSAVINSTLAEANKTNNQDQLQIGLKREIYLPIIFNPN